MNKIKYLILIAFLSLSFVAISQKKFKGVISYKITYGKSPIGESNMKLLPTELKVYFSKKYIKRVSVSKLGTTTIITDLKENKSQILIDLSTEKKYIRDYTPKKKNANRDFHDYKIIYTDKEKVISGYKCKYVKLVSTEDTLYGYYSEKMAFKGINISTPYSGVDFVLLEYIEKSNFPIIYEAVEIKRMKLDKSVFEVPEGFKRLLNL